jgi:hypothetical protein
MKTKYKSVRNTPFFHSPAPPALVASFPLDPDKAPVGGKGAVLVEVIADPKPDFKWLCDGNHLVQDNYKSTIKENSKVNTSNSESYK